MIGETQRQTREPCEYEIALAQLLRRETGNDGYGDLLDVGCGDGEFIDELLSIAPAREVRGIDIDGDSISRATSFFLKQEPAIPFYFHTGDPRSYRLPKKRFASIGLQDVLHHLVPGEFSHNLSPVLGREIEGLIDALDDLLDPRGLLILAEYVADQNPPPAQAVRTGIHNIKAEIDSLHGIPHSYCVEASTINGFLRESLVRRGYVICGGGIFATQSRPVDFGRRDRAAESVFGYFSRYIATLGDIPGAASAAVALATRLDALRERGRVHGLLAQRRLLIVARKPGGEGITKG